MKHLKKILPILLSATIFCSSAQETIPQTPLRMVSKASGKVLTPVTNTIITDTPEGTRLNDVVWSSKACAPENGKAKWYEIKGFVPNIVINGDKMYIQSAITQLSSLSQAWIEGDISADGGTVTFRTPQAYMINEAQPGDIRMLYATRLNATTGKVEESSMDIVFSIEDGNLTQTDGGLLSITDDAGNFYGYGDMEIKVTKINETTVTLPSDAVSSTYILNFLQSTGTQRQSAKIATAADDWYFSDPLGIEGVWFKGIRTGNTISVTTGQYMGSGSGYPMYLVAAREFYRTETDPMGQEQKVIDYKVLPDDIIFNVDPATGEVSSSQILLMSSSRTERGVAYAAFKEPCYVPWIPASATPATPAVNYYVDLKDYESLGLYGCILAFDIPSHGLNDEFIPQESLYYQLTFDNNPLEFYGTSMIPYYGQFVDNEIQAQLTVAGDSHTLQTISKPAESITLQSFYLFEDEPYPSETARYTIVDGQLVADSEATERIYEESETVTVNYYDLTGRKVQSSAENGILIRERILSDGSRKREKTYQKTNR